MPHPTVEKIRTLLKENALWHEVFEHEPVITSEDAAKIRTGYELHQGTKALIVRVTDKGNIKKFVMFVVPGDKRFDEGKVKDTLGFKNIRFATEQEVSEITGGIERGGVPPFGSLFGLATYFDQSIFNNEKIIVNAGDRSVSVGMFSKDLITVSPGEIKNIV